MCSWPKPGRFWFVELSPGHAVPPGSSRTSLSACGASRAPGMCSGPVCTMTQGSQLNAGMACREDVEKEMRKICISPQPQTQLTSTHPLSTGTAVKPSLKGPLSPQSTFNYAFLARTVLGEKNSQQIPPKHLLLGCGSLPANITTGKQPQPWKGSRENTRAGAQGCSSPPKPWGYLRTDLPDGPGARSRLSRRGNH